MKQQHNVECTTVNAGAVTIETRKVLKCAEDGRKYVEVTTTHRGPKAQVDRLKWKPFGSGKYKTTVCDDVYLEYVGEARKEVPWIPNGHYITLARNDGWSDHEIKQIRIAERPDLKWNEIFFRKQQATIAAAVARVRADIQREKDAAAAAASIGMEPESEQTQTEQTDAVAPSPMTVSKGMSMKDLLKQKAQQRKGGGGSATDGITAQLQKKREQRADRKLTIYVQNVPTDWSEEDIADQLENFQIRRISVTRKFNDSGNKVPVGSAFIECYEEDETERVLAHLNDRCCWGSMVVSAQHALPKKTQRS